MAAMAESAPEKGDWLKHNTEAFEGVRQSLEALGSDVVVRQVEVPKRSGSRDAFRKRLCACGS